MMTDDEIIAVVQARKEGKKIQARTTACDMGEQITAEWRDLNSLFTWQFGQFDYRVAPEPRQPREWWVHASPDNHPFDCAFSNPNALKTPLIHVREVIE